METTAFMRIDKFLWCIRVYKTRTLATDACKENRVIIQDVAVKPAREVKVGEEIRIRRGAVTFQWKIVELPKTRVGPKLVEQFAIDITTPEEREKLAIIKEGMNQRPRGLGRPTKKDRRDLDELFG